MSAPSFELSPLCRDSIVNLQTTLPRETTPPLSPRCTAPVVLVQPGLVCETAPTLSTLRVSDIENSQPGQGDPISQLLEESRRKILYIRQRKHWTIVTIMYRHRSLLNDMLHILKTRHHLTPRMLRFHTHLFNIKKPSQKMISRICRGLVVRELIPKTWLQKPPINFFLSTLNVNLKMLQVTINNIPTQAIIATGRNFSFVPYRIWIRLGLRPHASDIPAISDNQDAVGVAELSMSIRCDTNKCQVIKHKFLLLKNTSKFVYTYLADDFLLLNSAEIAWRKLLPPLTKLNDKIVPLMTKKAILKLVPPETYLVDGIDPPFPASASTSLPDHRQAAIQPSQITGANLAKSEENYLCNQFALLTGLQKNDPEFLF